MAHFPTYYSIDVSIINQLKIYYRTKDKARIFNPSNRPQEKKKKQYPKRKSIHKNLNKLLFELR